MMMRKVYHSCIDKGNILCSDCDRQRFCDMKAGRNLHQKAYDEGIRDALIATKKEIEMQIELSQPTDSGLIAINQDSAYKGGMKSILHWVEMELK